MLQANSTHTFLRVLETDHPRFQLIKEIPPSLSSQLQLAVLDFIACSHVPEGVDKTGLYQQTLKAIAGATYLNGGGDFWLATLNGQVAGYVLAHIGQDIDSKLSYTVSQAWVRKDQRGKPWVKEAWQKVKQRAKDCFCGHLVIISSRNDKAYCRFLGKGFHSYVSLLKEEI